MAEASRNPGMKSYLIVWNGLLYIAAAEVFLTYYGFSTHMLLAILLSLAFIEAGVALLYFMHLKYERPGLRWGSARRRAFRTADDESDMARRISHGQHRTSLAGEGPPTARNEYGAGE